MALPLPDRDPSTPPAQGAAASALLARDRGSSLPPVAGQDSLVLLLPGRSASVPSTPGRGALAPPVRSPRGQAALALPVHSCAALSGGRKSPHAPPIELDEGRLDPQAKLPVLVVCRQTKPPALLGRLGALSD